MKGVRVRDLVNLAFPLAVFVGALAFYIYTGPTDIAWLDGAHYQRRVALAEVGEGPWEQPLYVLLSQPFLLVPFGTLPQRASLASAVFAAGACLFVYLLLKALLTVAPQFIARRVGILAAITLGVSHTFWYRAVTPGPEVLDALMLAAILFCLVRFANEGRTTYFYAAMLILGLSLSNNLMMIFLFPFLAVWVRVVKPPLVRQIGMVRFRGLLLLLAGSALALAVAAWGWSAAGFRVPAEQMSWLTFWRDHMMLGWDGGLDHSLMLFTGMLLYNFPPWTATIGLLGLIELFQRQKYGFWLIFPLLAVYSLLAVTLTLAEPVPAYLPSWVLLSIAVGYGWWKTLSESSWMGYLTALVLTLLPLPIYHFAAPAIERIGEEVRVKALLRPPFEVPLGSLDYYLNPDRRDLPLARAFARATLNEIPERARVVTPSWDAEMLFAPARYLTDVEQPRPDLILETLGTNGADTLERWLREDETPLYLIGLHPPHPAVQGLLDRYDFIPAGYLFRVEPRPSFSEKVGAAWDEPIPITGEWSGFQRPQGYRVGFAIQEVPDGSLSGTAVLNPASARPLEGRFIRITHVGDSFLARVSYNNRVHVHIDAKQVGNRLEGTWQIFEAEGLTGTFVVWAERSTTNAPATALR